jgi:Flp pilus assembly protein TadB
MRTSPPTPRTVGELLWEVSDLAGGATVMLLPLLLLAVPGLTLFVLLPAIVLLAVAAAPTAVAGAVVVPSYLLVRAIKRRARAPRA